MLEGEERNPRPGRPRPADEGAWAFGPGMDRKDGDDEPAWWPYGREFPGWHVWRGVNSLVYARLLKSSPPVVVRGEDTLDLRDQIRREIALRQPPDR